MILFIIEKGSSFLHSSHLHWLGASSLIECLWVEQKGQKLCEIYLFPPFFFAWPAHMERGRKRGVNMQKGKRRGRKRRRKKKGRWERETKGETESKQAWARKENSTVVVMDNWSEGVRMVLCKLPRQPSHALMIIEDVSNAVVPRHSCALLFFFPPTTLGVDSSWPWSLGKKNKEKSSPGKKKKSPLHPHTAPPAKNSFFKKRKSGRNDMTCLSTDPSPSPCQPDVVSQPPFV